MSIFLKLSKEVKRSGFQIDKKWPEIYNRKICSNAKE